MARAIRKTGTVLYGIACVIAVFLTWEAIRFVFQLLFYIVTFQWL